MITLIHFFFYQITSIVVRLSCVHGLWIYVYTNFCFYLASYNIKQHEKFRQSTAYQLDKTEGSNKKEYLLWKVKKRISKTLKEIAI